MIESTPVKKIWIKDELMVRWECDRCGFIIGGVLHPDCLPHSSKHDCDEWIVKKIHES